MNYAISIAGFSAKLITKPFLAPEKHLDQIVLISTEDKRSSETVEKVREFMNNLDVKVVNRQVNDIYNFFEVSILLESITREFGIPQWLNVTSGPGIAISALTLYSINNNIPVVSYSDSNQKAFRFNLSASKNMFGYLEKNKLFLLCLLSGPLSLGEVTRRLNVSKSTVSRKMRKFSELSFVKIEKRRRGMIISLTDSSLKLLK